MGWKTSGDGLRTSSPCLPHPTRLVILSWGNLDVAYPRLLAVQLLQRNRILGDKVLETRWHSEVLRTTFTQDLPFILPELIDELPVAVQDNLPCTNGNGSALI